MLYFFFFDFFVCVSLVFSYLELIEGIFRRRRMLPPRLLLIKRSLRAVDTTEYLLLLYATDKFCLLSMLSFNRQGGSYSIETTILFPRVWVSTSVPN